MREKLEVIYESNIPHYSFLDEESVIKSMTDSYILGETELISWLTKKDYLSDKSDIILNEYINHKNNKK
jgi:hypothetical protein